ncbi:MAG TPA: PDZ domain-containing protein, partial [Candidatus Dormibacteraeota bacterium]|nr:PDZ domain-containing protein [Candidatus Dormibacteraeota bacterium]
MRRARATKWVAIAVLCYVVALTVVNLRYSPAVSVVNALFPRIAAGNAIDDTSIIAEWNVIRGSYVFRDVEAQLGTQGSEAGIVEALDQRFHDRFTSYLTRAQYDELRSTLAGKRQGSVGIALEARCAGAVQCTGGASPTEMVIEDVLVDQPAARAGVRPDDVLIGVGAKHFAIPATDIGSELSDASKAIRGSAGTGVDITVQRGTQQLTFHMQRADLKIPSVFSRRFG